MNADVLTTGVAVGIAVITLAAQGESTLTEALNGFAGDANVRVVVVTGGTGARRVLRTPRLLHGVSIRGHNCRRSRGLGAGDLHAVSSLFDQRGNRSGLRNIDGMAALDLDDRGIRPLGHRSLRGSWIIWSSVTTRYQLGLVLHAGSLTAR